MKTDDLIGSLVADHANPPASPRRTFAYAAPPALLGAILIFSYVLDMRPDLGDALMSWRYLFKVLVSASIAAFGLMLLFRMTKPQHDPAADIKWLALALAPLAVSLALETLMLPVDRWSASAMGFNPEYCVTLVPLIGLVPLAAALVTLRHGAPQSPTAAGAIAGFAAGGIGAFIYALHCDNDSPVYVAIWSMAAVGIVTLVGAVAGRFYLRW